VLKKTSLTDTLKEVQTKRTKVSYSFLKVTGNFGVQKNEEQFKNDYFVGTPDIITEDSIIDIKTSWDATTFPWFDSELPNKDYMYQLLAYMDLTGKLNGYVAYCLINHAEDAIQDEIRRETWKLKAIDPTPF
jgi:predicted phage-related endonuclease